MKEVYLYAPIFDFIAQELIANMEDNKSSELTLRVNCPGGSVFAAYGIYTKIKELGNVNLKVDGSAMSGAAFLPLYAKSSECLDVSRFVLHRADMYVEDGQDQEYLDGINADLKAKMKMKIDGKIFKEVTGYSIEDLFDPTQRIDITLTGPQAKKVGLIQKVNKLTPQMQSELTAFSKRFNVAAHVESEEEKNKTKNTIAMTLAELQSKHPELFASVLAMGVAQEKDRVEACLEYIEIDPEGVKAAIAGGKPLSQKDMAAFNVKMMSKSVLGKIEGDTTKTPLATPEALLKEKTEKEKVTADFAAEVSARLGLKASV